MRIFNNGKDKMGRVPPSTLDLMRLCESPYNSLFPYFCIELKTKPQMGLATPFAKIAYGIAERANISTRIDEGQMAK